MKAVAAALVLIVGAAVVLWYANTSNSLVLGGLIGGLAALLLSIPISLTLFSYFSRRNDERLRVEQEADRQREEMILQKLAERRRYEIEGSVSRVEDDSIQSYYDEPAHQLPAPQRRSQSLPRSPIVQQGTYIPARDERGEDGEQGTKGTVSSRRITRRIYYAGYSNEQEKSLRSKHQSAALRAARMEAVQQSRQDIEVTSPHLSRRPIPSTRKLLPEALDERDRSLRQQSAPSHQYPRRPRQGGSKPPEDQDLHRFQPPSNGARSRRGSQKGPDTDYLDDPYPQTETFPTAPQTGQSLRNPRIGERSQKEQTPVQENVVNRPLVRRAPYMYEDDPLRQELAQQIDTPIIRRSSRFLTNEEDETQE